MYAAYFGLTERPFSLAPDPRYLYLSDAHREALAHLLYGLGEGGNFVQLTGEVGTGKTTVCRALLEQLPPDVDVAMIFHPRLTSVELLAAVCDELRVPYPSGTTSLKVLVDALSQALLDAHARGRRTVLIIDEAQNLSARVLEEVRLLTNLETTKEKLLQVVLIGQPELADLLSRRNLRQLSQRVTARYHLRPFSEAESQRYVQHRMEVAGQRQAIFTRQAVRAAHRLSRGIPRLLNTICDRALLGAYATGQTRVKEAVVRRAAREVLGARRSWRWVAATAAAVLLVLVGSTIALVATGGLRSLGAWAFSRVEKAGPSPETPAPAPTVDERRAPEPTLAATLDDPSLTADRASAFVNLYALWSLDGAASPQPSGDPRARDSRRPEASRGAGAPRRRPGDDRDRPASSHAAGDRGGALLGRPIRDDLEVAGERAGAAPAGHAGPRRRLASAAARRARRTTDHGDGQPDLRRRAQAARRRLPAGRGAGTRRHRG